MRNPSSSTGARAAWVVAVSMLLLVTHTARAAEPSDGGIQLKQPGLQAEQIDSEKLESDSGGVSGKDVAPDTRPKTQTQLQVPLQREESFGAQEKARSALQAGASVPFELLEGSRTLGSGGADLGGRRPPGGFASEPPSIDKAELAIVNGPNWRWDRGTRGAGSVLDYGRRYEVGFEVKNLRDQPARYRPKYEMGNELRGFPEGTIEPGET